METQPHTGKQTQIHTRPTVLSHTHLKHTDTQSHTHTPTETHSHRHTHPQLATNRGQITYTTNPFILLSPTQPDQVKVWIGSTYTHDTHPPSVSVSHGHTHKNTDKHIHSRSGAHKWQWVRTFAVADLLSLLLFTPVLRAIFHSSYIFPFTFPFNTRGWGHSSQHIYVYFRPFSFRYTLTHVNK